MAIDCAVVAALPRELDRVRHHFRYTKVVERGEHTYLESMTPSGVTLVAAVAAGMGQVQSAILINRVIQEYQPKSIILVGIAAGLEPTTARLGDVVISDEIVDFSLEKVKPKGAEIRWSMYPVDQNLLARARDYRDVSWRNYIQTLRPSDLDTEPKAIFGMYLSGNKVIASAQAAKALRKTWRRAAALEMEGAGIAASLREISNAPGFLTIKGICDYANARKNDAWQPYAADAAASYAYSFVTEQLRPADLVLPHHMTAHVAIRGSGPNFHALRVALTGAFDVSELKVLCADLNINWGEIAGERMSERVADLLQYSKRHGRLADLIAYVNAERNGLLQGYADA